MVRITGKFKFSKINWPLRTWAFVAASSILLILAFPRMDWWLLAWVALVPLFLILDEKTPRQAFGTAYLAGVIFFAGTLYWFVHVTGLGATLIVLYLSLYYAVFGWFYARWAKRPLAEKMLVLPSAWVVLEYIRAHAFSGFGWAGLGYSQYQNLWLNQVADITGVYGISFLVVMANVFLKDQAVLYWRRKKYSVRDACSLEGVVLAAVLTVCVLYSFWRLSAPAAGEPLRVGVVQANIPQAMKWTQHAWPAIMEKHLFLTEELMKEKPDIIIWPETAFPGFLWQDPSRFEAIKAFAAKKNTPILLGTIDEEKGQYYNAAVLVSAKGQLTGQYNKLHLVPFGEYIPLRGQMPFLTDIIPIDDFTAGTEYTVFTLSPKEAKVRPSMFSVLICFEDGVSQIARRFVREGAQFLVNITNDAWFLDTKAPFLHLQASVFRAIENRRSVIRSANSGVSCFIDPKGRIIEAVESAGKQTFVSGFAVGAVYGSRQVSVYTKCGDIFTYLCFGCILWKMLRRKNPKASNPGGM